MKRLVSNPEFRMVSFAAAAALTAVLISACGDKKEEETELKPTFSSIYENVIVKNDCASCHQPGKAQYDTVKNLDLSSKANAYTTLTGAMQINGKPECDAGRYVTGGDLTTSALWAVLDEDTRTAFSAKVTDCSIISETEMNISVSAAEKTAIKEWISGGAKND